MICRNHHINGNERNFTVSKRIHARRNLVYDAWLHAGVVREWWGPHHFTNPVCKVDARTGGHFNIEMRAPDGVVFPMHGIYHQIIIPSLLVFTTTAFEDENGNSPLEYLNTVLFEDEDNATLLTMEAELRKAVPGIDCLMDGIREGWYQSFDKLESYIINRIIKL